jgi:hypothetical protein
MRALELGASKMRAAPEGQPVEMCAPEGGRPFEMRSYEGGSLKMSGCEVASLKNGTAKFETPVVGILTFPIRLASPLDHRQNGGRVRCRWSSYLSRLIDSAQNYSPHPAGELWRWLGQ